VFGGLHGDERLGAARLVVLSGVALDAALDEPQGKLLRARSLPLGHNAPRESIWGTLKNDLVHHQRNEIRA